MRTATGFIGIVVMSCPLLLPACSSTEKAPEGSSMNAVKMVASPELASAVEDYREGRYTQAFDAAKALARASSSPLREQAAWVAGLSAYQTNKFDDAELQFMASSRSQDQRLATDSKIMIGDVYVKQNRWSDAAQNYRDAAKTLSGEERSRVLGYADMASSNAAGRAGGQAGVTASSTPGSGTGTAKPSAGGSSPSPVATRSVFALQAGAFQSEANARKRASELAGQSRQAGFGDPRVVRTRDPGGRDFWTVQLGQFDSRQSADAAKSKIASVALIVTTAG